MMQAKEGKLTLLASLMVLILACCLGACNSSTPQDTSTIFTVNETGDKIRVGMDIKAGYTTDTQTPFTVSKDGKAVATGTFITLDAYNSYVKSITSISDNHITLLEENTKDGNPYIFYGFQDGADKEFNYLLQVGDSKTGILLGNKISEEEAKACFEALTFSVAK